MRVCPECDTRTEAERCPNDGRLTVEEERLKICTSDPNIGLVIEGKYELLERLGRGGMGSVYKAAHKETGGHVGIKVMRADMVEDEGAIRRFYIEAQNTHKLHHPNTVRVSDFGQTEDGILFLVMEYVKGQTLRQVLKDEGCLSPARAVHVIGQVLKSLGEAHEHGVIHRDIKPANVMLIDQFGEPDFVKVLDFGISRTMEGTGASTKGAIGTPKYMAPEQWRGEKVDPRADLYACGCLLYRMLCGRLPFEIQGMGSQEVVGYMTAHLNETPRSVSDLMAGEIPAELETLVMALLEKDAADRPADAQATLEQLRALEKSGGLAEEVVAADQTKTIWPAGPEDATRTPGGSLVSDRPTELLPGSPPPSNISGTGFPGTGHLPQASKPRRLGRALALTLVVVLTGGLGAWLLLAGDDSAPVSAVEQPAAQIAEASAEVAPAQALEASQPPAAAPAPAAPAKRLLTITSTPSGARVRAPDGRVIGTTPTTLSRRSDLGAAQATLTILPNASEHPLDAIVLTKEGYGDKPVILEFPQEPGAEGTVSVVLQAKVVLPVSADRKGIKVRVLGETEHLGRTPFDWQVPDDLTAKVRAGETVHLEFLTPTGPVRVALTPEHLDGKVALEGQVRSRMKSSSRKGPKKKGKSKKLFNW